MKTKPKTKKPSETPASEKDAAPDRNARHNKKAFGWNTK